MTASNTPDDADPATGFQGRPVLMETVAEDDALNDLTSAQDLCDRLAPAYDSHLLWLSNEPQNARDRRDALCFWNGDPKLPGKMRTLFKRLAPDILHTHRFDELAMVGYVAQKAGVPHIVHSVCGKITGADEWLFNQLAEIVDGLSAVLIAPDEKTAEKLPRAARIEILPAGVDCERYVPGDQASARRKIGLPAHPRIIGCCNSADGLAPLLQTAFQMDGDIHLALFGQGQPGTDERALIRLLGLEERVHILGAWANPELIFQAIDVFFHGPSADRLPRPLLAAQACGKTAIACAPAPSEALCPQTGRLAPSQFVPTLRHSLRCALASAEPETTRQFIVDNWNIEGSAAKYSALFKELTDQGQRNRRLA